MAASAQYEADAAQQRRSQHRHITGRSSAVGPQARVRPTDAALAQRQDSNQTPYAPVPQLHATPNYVVSCAAK